MRKAILPAVLGLALVGSAPALAQQPSADMDINGQTQLFCQDDRGDIRPMTYFNLGDVMRRYMDRFQFVMTVQKTPMQLVFSAPGVPYSITYNAQPYRDDAGRTGIALLKMHIFLDNADRDVQGSAMCYFTQFGK